MINCCRNLEKFGGISLGLFGSLCAIDIDGCLFYDAKRKMMSAMAADILKVFHTYAEVSQSGSGIHLYFMLDEPAYDKERYYINHPQNKLEIYCPGMTSKAVTVTGRQIAGTPSDLASGAKAKEALNYILEAYMLRPLAGDQSPASIACVDAKENSSKHITKPLSMLSDDEIIEKAQSARNGWKFRDYWQGSYTSSASEADLGLCNLLAFWTGGDQEQIDRIFRRSALYRSKWDRADYSNRTIHKAINGCNGVFYAAKNS